MNLRISELPGAARLAVLAALAAGALACLRAGSEAQGSWRRFPPPLARPIPPKLSSFALAWALADESRVASDWGYIDCLQYVGGPYMADGFWGRTQQLYWEVQWLDPSFKHAVIEGISTTGWFFRRPEEAAELAHAALAADPKEPRYGAYIAALAYQKHLDPEAVIATLAPEVRRADAPEMLLRVEGNLILKQGDWKRSLDYWTWLQGRAHEQLTLDMAARTLAQIRRHTQGPAGTPSPKP
jgi:hypothetical protein